MKTKLLSLNLIFASAFAVASQFPNPLLEKQFSSGYVAPEHIRQSNCQLYPKVHQLHSSQVIINTKTGPHLELQPTVEKPIKWNAQVPNEVTLERLVQQAKLDDGHKKPLLLPSDVASIKHSAIETFGAGAPSYLTLRWQNSDGQGEENPSQAAKYLVNFLDLNCQ